MENCSTLVPMAGHKYIVAKGQGSEYRAHILIVDDEKDIRKGIQEAIQDAGYVCGVVASGDEALRYLEKKHVDLIIADIKMPGLNGLELTEIVRKKYDTDVMIITGYGKDFQYENAIEKGASEFILKPFSFQELVVRLRRVLRERALFAEQRQREKWLREMIITDDLTNLYNMRHFHTQLQLEMDRALRYNHPMSLLLLDVDRFKLYNDTHGHLEGDQVLIVLGEVIRGCLRKYDSAYRYGGDEFMVVLPETVGGKAREVAERIRTRFLGAFFRDRVLTGGISVTLSVGVVEHHQGENLSDFVERADQAMYQAKKQGGDQTILAVVTPWFL